MTSLINEKFNDVYLIKTPKYEVNTNKSKEFKTLENSIKNKLQITCTYNNKTRTLKPYRLINKSGIWYLSADEDNQLKTYTINKITNLKSTNIEFLHNQEFYQNNKTKQR